MLRNRFFFIVLFCLFFIGIVVFNNDIVISNDKTTNSENANQNNNDQHVVENINLAIEKLDELLLNLKNELHNNKANNGHIKVANSSVNGYDIAPGQLVSHIELYMNFLLKKVLKEYETGNYAEALKIYEERKEQINGENIFPTIKALYPDVEAIVDEIVQLDYAIYRGLQISADTSLPVVDFDNMNTFNKLRVPVTGTYSDEGSGIAAIYVNVNGGEWQQAWPDGSFSGSWVIDVSLNEGANELSTFAIDSAGNESEIKTTTITTDISNLEPGDIVWDFRTNPTEYCDPFSYSNPVIVDGKVYIGTSGTFEGNKLYCLDLRNGEPLWTWTFGIYDGIYRAPAIADNKLFIATGNMWYGPSSVYAFDISGEAPQKLWQYDINEPIRSNPCIYKGRVYFGGYNKILNFDANYNNTDVPPTPQIIQLPGDTTYQCSVAAHDDKIYIGCSNNQGLYMCYSLDGQEIWRVNKVFSSIYNASVEATPTIGNTKLLGGFYNDPFAVDKNTGESSWTYAYNGDYVASPIYYNNPVNGKEYAYFLQSEGDILCLDVKTGTLVWNAHESWGQLHSAPIYSNGRIYVNTTGGQHLKVRSYDGSNGNRLWEKIIFYAGTATSNPAMSENKFVIGGSRKVYCLTTPNSNSGGKDWPTFCQNNRRTQSFLDGTPPPEQPDEPTVMWKIDDPNINNLMSTQITYTNSESGRVLFVASKDEFYNDTKLYCYDANPYTSGSQPAKVWEFLLGNKCNGVSPTVVRGVTINGAQHDVVYIAGESKAYCIDMKTGQELWSSAISGYGWRTAIYVEGTTPKVYFGTLDKVSGTPPEQVPPGVFCYNALSGELLWNCSGPTLPLLPQDIIIDMAYSPTTNSIYALSYRNPCKLMRFSADVVSEGESQKTWEYSIPASKSEAGGSVIVSNGEVYVSTASGLFILEDNTNNANLVWQSHPAYGTYSPPVISGNYLYSKLANGYLIRYFNDNRELNNPRDMSFSAINVGGEEWGTFAITSGKLYIGVNYATNVGLQCYNTETGLSEWESPINTGETILLQNGLRGGPAVATNSPWNSFTYCGTKTGKILCVSTKESNGGNPWIMYSHDYYHTGTNN